jgi:transcription-repair coupling factor (superfamily II helicase)
MMWMTSNNVVEIQKQQNLMLTPPIPGPERGKRFTLDYCIGSSDAGIIAENAKIYRDSFSVMVVICSDPTTAHRLSQEIPLFDDTLRVSLLPDWEILPYDQFSPHHDLVSERLKTLHEMMSGFTDIVIVPISSCITKIAPPEFLAANTFFFQQGATLNEVTFISQLQQGGYDSVSAVVRPGEYSIRGGLIDLFPMGATLPFRIDLFGDTIDQIKVFDPDTQRSLYPVKEIKLLPGHEFPFHEQARKEFRGKWREVFDGNPGKCPLYKDVGLGIPGAGIESYLPLFFEKTALIFDYFPRSDHPPWIWGIGNLQEAIQDYWRGIAERYQFLSHDTEHPLLEPPALYANEENIFSLLKAFPRVFLNIDGSTEENPYFAPPPAVAVIRRNKDPIYDLKHFILEAQHRVLICADSPGRRESIKQLLDDSSLQHPTERIVFQEHASITDFMQSNDAVGIVVAPLFDGFVAKKHRLVILTETEIFANSADQRKAGKIGKKDQATNIEFLVRDLSELKVGDPVVHSEHGIGRYQGLLILDLGDGDEEFLHLRYANSATLYVPVHQLHLISRYSGSDPENAPLHNLGSGQWEKAKRKAAEQIRDTAAELLNIYAKRALRKGHAFEYSSHDYDAFAESFGFEETVDQQNAISEVIKDMTSGQPMDRLICGDVGFGKTEVALRASFVAVMGGKQVAVLAPTTLLSEQHATTWKNRFADWPVKIVEVSRFQTTREIKTALEALENGDADIIIGTHKLLSPDIKFKRLGLVIIDEEHRFGVRQKETFKALRAEVDVLTLTATPIPRTLGMALEGLRELSVIATAPQKRLAIKTFVRREGDSVIREAILRELKRGGQVYFLHNEVETIENRKQYLEKLIPEARIGVAHGQMHERNLEQVMHDFVAKRCNVLLCSTIIETGIDVPSANTIIMHRADKFGLAQLHQLRGRVGRSHHQAYAYLLVPDPDGLSKQAKLRLEAIVSMEELGSGFYLAMHDLEIRGAGEVLGDKQSGDIHEIGFQLYTDMLNKAISDLKKGKEPDILSPMHAITDISLGSPALLPNLYCPDVHERLSLYKRLSSAQKYEDIDDIHIEIIDRFGEMPDATQVLLENHRLRINMEKLGIKKIEAGTEAIKVQFIPNPPIDSIKIIQLIQKDKYIQLSGPDKLKLIPNPANAFTNLQQRIQVLKKLLSSLS